MLQIYLIIKIAKDPTIPIHSNPFQFIPIYFAAVPTMSMAEERAGLIAESPESPKKSIGRKFVDHLIPPFDPKWRYSPLLMEPKRPPAFCRMPPRLICALLMALFLVLFIFTLLQTIQKSFQIDHSSFFNNAPSKALVPPPFNRWALEGNESFSLDCARIISNDSAYIREMAAQRIQFADPPDLDMDCESGIRWRNYFPKEVVNEGDFPLAQARIVYRDYVFLEMELAAAYSPQNWYCYILDRKSDPIFHSRMRKLAECLPNVLIAPREWNFDGGGHNITRAHLQCLEMLATDQKQWNYVALLQNHDSAIKTNRQMTQIYKWLDGANDVEITYLPGGRVNDSLDWSFEAIGMFRGNSPRNWKNSSNGFAPELIFSKGYVQSSLSREMVEFMLNELDLAETVRRLEAGGFGIDEILVPTLQAADALQAPGGFTHACLEKNKRIQHITRASIWYNDKACGSHHMRHAICVFGLEDLPLHVDIWPHLFANKFQPDFDFGAAVCWYEAMHNRTHNPGEAELAIASLDAEFYADLAHVRFQKFKRNLAKLNNRSMFIPYREAIGYFNCTSAFKNDNK